MHRISPSKSSTHDRRLTVKDVLGRGLLELGVPDQTHAVGVVRRVVAIVVGCQQQLGVRRRPVHACDAAPAGPALVVERTHQRQARQGLVVTVKCDCVVSVSGQYFRYLENGKKMSMVDDECFVL